MDKVTYQDHTIELTSGQGARTRKWSPKATVIFVGVSQTMTHVIQPAGAYDTEAEANEVALEKAKGWIDQGKH